MILHQDIPASFLGDKQKKFLRVWKESIADTEKVVDRSYIDLSFLSKSKYDGMIEVGSAWRSVSKNFCSMD
jgi:hypothetical protein